LAAAAAAAAGGGGGKMVNRTTGVCLIVPGRS